jgi:hypothetical protein
MVENSENHHVFQQTEQGMLKSTLQNSNRDKVETEEFLENVHNLGGKFENGLDFAAGVGRYRAFLDGECNQVYSNEINPDSFEHINYAHVDQKYLIRCDIN